MVTTTATMARLEFGRLTEAWTGEASDFTPLLASQLDQVGAAIGVDLAAIGPSEVATTGGRRIDIVAEGADGAEFIIENQYGRADHDHLTRGLAYAVARRARGLVLIAEEHRDEFRALAAYLNRMAELDRDNGISVWLVEAKAVRIAGSPWAPLFTTVIEPNSFTTVVEQAKQASHGVTESEFWEQFTDDATRAVVQRIVANWLQVGYRRRFGPNHVVLEAPGPATSKFRTVVALYSDGRVLVPFSSYAGVNSGIGIEPLMSDSFRNRADTLFGFKGTEQQARTTPGWITPTVADPLWAFCREVAGAYAAALAAANEPADSNSTE
jgi:hypothetical protein